MAANLTDWLAWPSRSITAAIVLTPDLVLAGWTAAGGGFANTYKIACSRFTLTDVLAGGIYRRVVGLRENQAALTAAAVSFYVSNDGSVINLTDGDPSTGIPFRPWVPGDLPAITREMEDFFFGSKITATSRITILNQAYALYRLLAVDGDYWWKDAPVAISLGGTYNGLTLPWSAFLPYVTMLVDDVGCDDQQAENDLQGDVARHPTSARLFDPRAGHDRKLPRLRVANKKMYTQMKTTAPSANEIADP